MSLIKEFKEFAVKGNVIDLAVAVIIGVAFGKIVSSLVADVVMPPIGVLMGGVDFSDLSIVIKEAVGEAPAVVIAYGAFIQTVVDFMIIAFVIFMAVKGINRLKKEDVVVEEVKAEPAPSDEVLLLSEIRDLLKAQKNL
ncbi:large-conductance mechanosensitive channel protein MscL [Thiomicrorhabdus aquaedulcis]|uniref:large-conductance mechanosensitive channel protein MscL n=1 Tax=Thiomicrorhabdus aquaedulcis TaxID=2211106 RepID=UPI000FDAEB69|nr:large-conductance mechanosensitive channel protein MscL [Thiomicrorhabdus aquaedulcis]